MGTKVSLAAALAAAAVAAGCGGAGQTAEPERYELGPSQACLQEGGVRVRTTGLDFVASTALGGAMRVQLETDNFVDVSFGEDAGEAERIELAYRRFAGRSIPIDDVLLRTKNVVMVWNAPPTAEERDTLFGCLEGPG
ncbi:MAG: hypothetical protein WD981_05860 [Gaiellaceae bacterium]